MNWRRLLLPSAICLLPSLAGAQAPNEKWRTIETTHFYVHFPAALEHVARRGAGSAERAYAMLSPLLTPARGRIDLLITDNVDYSNGFTYVSPSPRIVIYARPPVDDRTLRFRDDWFDLVIQHELVHAFQLDRTKGWWLVAQHVFGRQPLLFPNMWAPSWLLEGLAVHYESRLGDGGRIEGMAHVPYVNAMALDNALPRLGEWSGATLKFPGGSMPYIYGSLLMEDMEARGGAGSVEKFVEHASARALPWSFEGFARENFKTTFAEQWQRFADSVTMAVKNASVARSVALTPAQWLARHPRVGPDSRIYYVASNGRETAGLYVVDATGGKRTRLARRNSMDVNVPLRDGRFVFAQYEWADPYRLYSDLWIREADGSEHQLTYHARVFAPDARERDGAIVAVQNVAGTTRLVRVSATGDITPVTAAHIDTTWSAPRWSHDGSLIVATRWSRGGEMAIVVLDSLGRGGPRVVASERATVDDPAWSADDKWIFYTVNKTGTAAVYRVGFGQGGRSVVAAGVTSLDAPQPVGNGFVAVETRAAGERLVRADLPTAPPPSGEEGAGPHVAPPADTSAAPVQPYRPLRQLVPRFWLPSIESTDEGRTRYGAWIGSDDIANRHAYAAVAQFEPKRGEFSGFFNYRYSGLGLPLVDVAVSSEWDHTDIFDSTKTKVGVLSRQRRFIGAALTTMRQRVRTMWLVSGSADLEFRDFVTDPAPLISKLGSPLYLKTLKYPTFSAYAAWANTRTPILAFGPEDGVNVSATVRYRWRTDDAAATRSSTLILAGNAFKSLEFIPGASHHVIALHGAIGTTDEKTNTQLEAGGLSGSSAEIAPGLAVGDVRRNFFVRGFPAGVQAGIRAMGGSAEWRAPLAMPDWGTHFVPFFAQRVAATLFADGAQAWCPAGVKRGTVACPWGQTPRTVMSSVGAELSMDAAVLNYDAPYRLRLGFAKPVQGRAYASAPNGSVYFSLGMSF